MRNPAMGYDTWILNDLGHQRTLAANHEFGGLGSVVQRVVLMSRILECMGASNRPLSVADLQCDSQDNGSVFLSWQNRALYDQIHLFRNSELLAILDGTTESYVDTGIAAGTFEYQVYAFRDGAVAPIRECSVLMITPNNAIVAASVAAAPGTEALHQVRLSAEQSPSYGAVEAYAYGVTFDPQSLQVVEVVAAGSAAESASFFLADFDNVVGHYTVQASFNSPSSFPNAYNVPLASATFEVAAGVSLGTRLPLAIPPRRQRRSHHDHAIGESVFSCSLCRHFPGRGPRGVLTAGRECDRCAGAIGNPSAYVRDLPDSPHRVLLWSRLQ